MRDRRKPQSDPCVRRACASNLKSAASFSSPPPPPSPSPSTFSSRGPSRSAPSFHDPECNRTSSERVGVEAGRDFCCVRRRGYCVTVVSALDGIQIQVKRATWRPRGSSGKLAWGRASTLAVDTRRRHRLAKSRALLFGADVSRVGLSCVGVVGALVAHSHTRTMSSGRKRAARADVRANGRDDNARESLFLAM